MATLMSATVVGLRDPGGGIALREAEVGRLPCDGLTPARSTDRSKGHHGAGPSGDRPVSHPRVSSTEQVPRGLDDTVLSWRGASPIDDSPASLH